MNNRNVLVQRFDAACSVLPLVAILRGIRPEEAGEIACGLYSAGFRLIEVPLNSPEPFDSIARMRRAVPGDALVGAGTVLTQEQLSQLIDSGGELAVMPHTDPELISAANLSGLLTLPGVATPSEAFSALRAGADALKIFPAELITPAIIKAMNVVLPQGTRLFPVGGITPDTMAAYREAGAGGFGLGSALYKPGMRVDQVVERAGRFVASWNSLLRC